MKRGLKYEITTSLRVPMSNLPHPVVTEAAYLTLHYRLASMDGTDIVSTFRERPATLQLGTGQLAPFLEACLMGLPEGAHQNFDLPPEKAFGPRNPDMIQRMSRATLDENSSSDQQYAVGDLVDFAAPGGGRFAGVLREIDGDGALFDFNHPLAGEAVKFEVKIIGIL
jgi:FKBP-type peptidyl-prolyl cis-trans isomerase SlpA